ncbi:MAG: NmrA family transcriptional regulator [Nocardioidaceae bacterium]
MTYTTRHHGHHQQPVLVIGSTGKTGRRVAARLEARGIPVRAVSRSTPVRFDWEDESTWPSALEGAAAAYVTYQPDLALPSAAQQVSRLAGLAAEAGVDRAVLLSGRGEAGALAGEQAMLHALPHSTVVRCSWFFQNFTEGAFRDSVLDGVIALPVSPNIGEPFLDANDIADIAVLALTEQGHAGRVHELTGPQPLTFPQVADALTAAVGWPVQFVEVSVPEFVDGAVQVGMPEPEARMLASLFAEVLDGRNTATTSNVSRLLGRPARDFSSFTRAAARAGAWASERVG